MSTIHEWSPPDVGQLSQKLHERLGIEDAASVVGSILDVSERLWQPGSDRSEPETFHSLIGRDEASAVVRVLVAHADHVDPWSPDRLVDVHRDDGFGWRWEATTTLVTGALALGTVEHDPGLDRDKLFDTLTHVAFGGDDLTVLVRTVFVIGAGDPWPPFPTGHEFELPDLGVTCVMNIQAAGVRLAGSIAGMRAAEASPPAVDADGITSLSPSSGSAGDSVAIFGTFPSGPRTVLFPRAGGGDVPASATWTTSRIDAIAPDGVGDGPVGFLTESSTLQAVDVSAPLEFANALAGCLGRSVAPVAGRLASVGPAGLGRPRPAVPTLPNDANVFHGGPILMSVSPTSGSEPGPPVTVTGKNLASGDTVVLDGVAAPTTFVNSTTLKFTVPAVAAGSHFLQIRRGYHRSNGTTFDVRATLKATPPPGRVAPGAEAELSGTGFGPTITATVDGAPTKVRVADTHTLEVGVRRPSQSPIASQKRGEPVTVEVFDRGVSLGTVTVTVDTFRIASFGDSIIWGQGLLETQKFTMLVADAVTARRNGTIAVFALDRCAHSGATVRPVVGESPDPAAPRPPGDFTGECPRSVPSIAAQLSGWMTPPLSAERGEIDLVLIDGGINDVDVRTIVDPFGSDTALATATTAACFSAMNGVLTTVLAAFPNAKVVVTGYYPIVSSQTDMAFMIPVLAGLGVLGTLVVAPVVGATPVGLGAVAAAIFVAWARQRLIDRSAVFAAAANAALASSVAAFGPRVALAVPTFGPANAIFAPDAFVFGVGLSAGGLVALDPVAGTRVATCGAGSVLTTVASIGHPNAKGAQAYADAIGAALPRLGL
jgi:IPT/TIG domain